MAIQSVGVPFLLVVHSADIIRRNNKPDIIIISTNLPSPVFPFQGTLSIQIQVNKMTAEKWIKDNIPQLKDISLYDESHITNRPSISLKSRT
jgi:hypothetical protein